ncbi:MAG TPA: DUF4214 domain-containing protein [Burkholderiaceae bacterium]|jgi:sugar lactone lactonase YvrE
MARSFVHTAAVALLIFGTAFSLGGCGGNPGEAADAQNKLQARQPGRMAKQAGSPYASAVQELYVAYFGRPADPAGLTNFAAALAAANAPADLQSLTSAYSTNQAVRTLIDSFGTSKESQTLYGSGTTQDFVTAVFKNVLGRAPQQAGLSYWSDAIDKGSLSKGNAALAIMNGALTNTTAQGLIDAQLVNNRLAVAASFTAQTASQGATYAYTGAGAAAAARAMLSQVDGQTQVASFSPTISTTITGLLHSAPGVSLLAGDIRPGNNQNAAGPMVRDSVGNLYVIHDYVIDKITPDGTFTVFAGTPNVTGYADGTGTAAMFNYLNGIGIDSRDNLYVSDMYNHVIRKITPAGVVTTFAGSQIQPGNADGTGAAAQFANPGAMVVDAADNIYVMDNSLRKISPAGVVTTVNGYGGPCGNIALGSCFAQVEAMTMDSSGNLYIAESWFNTVRKMTRDGAVSIIAGAPGVRGMTDGPAANASFEHPRAIAVDNAGNLFVGDGVYYDFGAQSFSPDLTIRKISVDGTVSTVAGAASPSGGYVDGPAQISRLDGAYGMLFDAQGNLVFCDGIGALRKLSPSGIVSTVAGFYGFVGIADGLSAAAGFYQPKGIVADSDGNAYVVDSRNDTIRKITPAGYVTTLAGTAQLALSRDGSLAAATFLNPVGLARDAGGNMYVTENGSVRRISTTGTVTQLATGIDLTIAGNQFYFYNPCGIAVDLSGNVYATDTTINGVIKIAPNGTAAPLAGFSSIGGSNDGTGTAASFKKPSGIALDAAGYAYVADTGNNSIRKISPAGVVTTLAGSAGNAGAADGAGSAARFNQPIGVALDPSGNLYVADSGNNLIRKITPAGVVSTVAGTTNAYRTILGPLPAAIQSPQYLTLVGAKTLYVTAANAVVQVNLP